MKKVIAAALTILPLALASCGGATQPKPQTDVASQVTYTYYDRVAVSDKSFTVPADGTVYLLDEATPDGSAAVATVTLTPNTTVTCNAALFKLSAWKSSYACYKRQ